MSRTEALIEAAELDISESQAKMTDINAKLEMLRQDQKRRRKYSKPWDENKRVIRILEGQLHILEQMIVTAQSEIRRLHFEANATSEDPWVSIPARLHLNTKSGAKYDEKKFMWLCESIQDLLMGRVEPDDLAAVAEWFARNLIDHPTDQPQTEIESRYEGIACGIREARLRKLAAAMIDIPGLADLHETATRYYGETSALPSRQELHGKVFGYLDIGELKEADAAVKLAIAWVEKRKAEEAAAQETARKEAEQQEQIRQRRLAAKVDQEMLKAFQRLNKGEREMLESWNGERFAAHNWDAVAKLKEHYLVVDNWPTKTALAFIENFLIETEQLRHGRAFSDYIPGSGKVGNPSESYIGEVNGKRWHSNGHFALEGHPPKNWNGEPRSVDMEYLLPKDLSSWKEVRPVGVSRSGSHMADTTTLWLNNGAAINARYFDHVMSRKYPDVKFLHHPTEKDLQIIIQSLGETIGVLMPIGDPTMPEGIKKLLEKNL